MQEKYREICQKLQTVLSKDRFEHSLGVSYTAAALAMAHKFDMEKAFLAGLLHDCAKHLSLDAMLSLCAEYCEQLPEDHLKSPQVLHAPCGALLAKYHYGISDEEILSAIRLHTTGAAFMSTLDKIIFIADYIEPSRHKAQHLALIRETAFKDLRYTVYLIVKDTVEYLRGKNVYINRNTLECLKDLEVNGIYDK
ncbi:bis(5'-nucleosyl)-tetraphosphatase (symmetrical) YqeK [Bacteroides heparinolyticus]|uniref:bis(5'-nucleosyl)-tetraphosphatase (symmetrical) YqeK n=2 Tax=Prevotella heparinolytica TaxID=28113 RepID=UPI0035A0508C